MYTQHEEGKPLPRDTFESQKATSYSGARFHVEGGKLIKAAKGIGVSGKMQQEFYYSNDLIFRTPAIYDIADDVVVMQNLPYAINAAEYLCNLTSMVNIRQEIIRYITFIVGNLRVETLFPKEPFWRKLLQIISRLTTVEDIRLCERVAYFVEAHPRKWEAGYAHGDFTFSNILYHSWHSYLIDFTPGYIQTPHLDLVKLKQEYRLAWTGRLCKLPGNYPTILRMLKKEIEEYNFADTSVLEAINLLRILPYAKDAEMTKLLRYNINKLL